VLDNSSRLGKFKEKLIEIKSGIMLSECLIFHQKSGSVYAYKRYAYKKTSKSNENHFPNVFNHLDLD